MSKERTQLMWKDDCRMVSKDSRYARNSESGCKNKGPGARDRERRVTVDTVLHRRFLSHNWTQFLLRSELQLQNNLHFRAFCRLVEVAIGRRQKKKGFQAKNIPGTPWIDIASSAGAWFPTSLWF